MSAQPEVQSGGDERPAFLKAWDVGVPVIRHDYLDSKGITNPAVLARLRVVVWKKHEYLALPYRHVCSGELLTVQRVYREGDKWQKHSLAGSRWAGAALNIGSDEPDASYDGGVLVAEGIASAYVCWLADSQCVALSAGTVGNLDDVAVAARQRWPHARVVVVADAGQVKAANAAAAACDGWLAAMPEGSPDGFDAWDFVLNHGGEPDELKRLVLDHAVQVAPAKEERDEKRSEAGIESARCRLKSFSDIDEEAIDWLWNGWLPRGKLTLGAGMGGSGKTTSALDFAGILTTCGTWPDTTQCERAQDVVIWSGEDDAGDTLKPRLRVAGADMSRVFLAVGESRDGKETAFDPAVHMISLIEQCAGRDVGLIIIDPIMNMIRGDAYRANEVRRELQPVLDLARRTGAAVFGITHFSKSSKEGSRKAIERVLGSGAFVHVARMVLLFAHNERTDARVMARAKTNIAPERGGFAFTTISETGDKSITAQGIAWGDYLDMSPDEIVDSVDTTFDDAREDRSTTAQAERFLRDYLSDGKRLRDDLFHDARGAGIPWRAIERAADDKHLNVQKQKPHGQGRYAKWWWALPK
ncbi:AAA family ATPase [Paraburkholderia adhaesiva]|uniref:AAA family ATPase n=1 Tax=Paraburkholderia adhaesiva TaxID=2883244 RepID=UPI001F249159|nr:AAA family ATPase [Paraburkholderia adhaesiva]